MMIPIKYDDLTVGQYMAIVKTLDIEDDTERNNKRLSILTGKPEDYFMNIDLSILSFYYKQLSFLNFEPEIKTYKKELYFGFKKYKATLDLTELNTMQLLDFYNILKANDYKIASCLDLLISIIYVNKDYKPESIEYVRKKVLDVKLKHCLGAVFFYSEIWKRCEGIIVTYLEKQVSEIQEVMDMIQTDTEFQTFLRTGVGSIA